MLEETGAEAETLASVSSEPRGRVRQRRPQCLDPTFVCQAVGGITHVGDGEPTDVGWVAPNQLLGPLARGSP